MAVVILGGLVTTTFLSLFVLPALYLRYGAGHEPRAGSRGGAAAPLGRRRAGAGGRRRGCRRSGGEPAARQPPSPTQPGPTTGRVSQVRISRLSELRARRSAPALVVASPACRSRPARRSRRSPRPATSPRTLEAVKGAKEDDVKRVDVHAGGRRRGPASRRRRCGAAAGGTVVPVRGADLQRRGQDVRLHEPEAAVVPAGGGEGRPHRGRPGVPAQRGRPPAPRS